MERLYRELLVAWGWTLRERETRAVPRYPPDLPMTASQRSISAPRQADHQVVVIAGETGSRQNHANSENVPGGGLGIAGRSAAPSRGAAGGACPAHAARPRS